MAGLVGATRAELATRLGGYPGLAEHAADDFVVAAGLGAMAGPLGSLVLASRAVANDAP
jgi:fructokinase